MPQLRNPLDEVRIPFAKMSFTPDVPSTALGANEYNSGLNVETDVRGIRSVAGDQAIFDLLPDVPVFVTGGFRRGGEFWFLVATASGTWFASNGKKYQYSPLPAPKEMWYNITSPASTSPGYPQNVNITEAWNGNVVFLNDTQQPPMFWPDEDPGSFAVPQIKLTRYSNQVPLDITNIVALTTTSKRVTIANTSGSPPYQNGDLIVISGATPTQLNGVWGVTACTATTVDILCDVAQPYSNGGSLAPRFSWNYNPNWTSVTAEWLRIYNTPNVGSILVAGNLTAVNLVSATERYPVTVQWSQNFGLNEAPLTWEPTVTNIANQLEVPLRGPAIDAFPSNGQLFLQSYWDTVVFSPLNYSTTSTPILGVRLFNQGRGLLSSNCWANTDKLVYGVDARDIWVFDGQDFRGLGNQRVKNWFYDQLDPRYYDRVHMEVNTQKNQIEIYYPDSDAVNGVPNKMLAYRYDLDCWNAPREVSSATFACESPIWSYNNITGEYSPNLSTRTLVYANVNGVNSTLAQKDIGYTKLNGTAIASSFKRDNIKMLKDYSGKLMVHRILPEAVNIGAVPFTSTDEIEIIPSPGQISITIEGAGSVGSLPAQVTPVTMNLDTDNPWCQINQNAHRVNSIEVSNSSTTNIWMCAAVTWQFTQVEDDR